MTRFQISQGRFSRAIAAAIFAFVFAAVIGGCESGTSQNKTVNPGAAPPSTPVAARTPLTGADLYAINCNRCHPERSAIERRPTEWKTLLTHMRVRANLPASQARTILQYLQENSGS